MRTEDLPREGCEEPARLLGDVPKRVPNFISCSNAPLVSKIPCPNQVTDISHSGSPARTRRRCSASRAACRPFVCLSFPNFAICNAPCNNQPIVLQQSPQAFFRVTRGRADALFPERRLLSRRLRLMRAAPEAPFGGLWLFFWTRFRVGTRRSGVGLRTPASYSWSWLLKARVRVRPRGEQAVDCGRAGVT